jgi:hypothetical protein
MQSTHSQRNTGLGRRQETARSPRMKRKMTTCEGLKAQVKPRQSAKDDVKRLNGEPLWEYPPYPDHHLRPPDRHGHLNRPNRRH